MCFKILKFSVYPQTYYRAIYSRVRSISSINSTSVVSKMVCCPEIIPLSYSFESRYVIDSNTIHTHE
jgi:hypothetical protein